MNASRAAVVVSAIFGKAASLFGYAFGLFGVVGFTVEVNGDKSAVGFAMSVIFMASAIFLIIKGILIKRRIKRFKRYISLITLNQMTSIDKIAASTFQSAQYVINDLQKMIYKKYFVNASIDIAANEIIIGNRTASAPYAASYAAPPHNSMQTELEVFNCPGCGASGARSKGVPGKCDYCGSFVK